MIYYTSGLSAFADLQLNLGTKTTWLGLTTKTTLLGVGQDHTSG